MGDKAPALSRASTPRIIDISPAVHPGIGVWPGDTPLRRDVLADLAHGDNLTLSALHSTVHLGAHADGPNHTVAGQPSIAEVDLAPYLGPCQVIRVDIGRGERISVDHLRVEVTAPRILLATGTYPDPDQFTTDFAALAPALVEHLADSGVTLIGIDTPSVDLFESTDLPTHATLVRLGVRWLEGIVLAHVEPGRYDLVALPLRLVGFEASPVRAVLVKLD